MKKENQNGIWLTEVHLIKDVQVSKCNGCVMVKALACNSRGREFDSRQFHS